MKPIRLFDQAPDSFTETPRTPPGAVDYPLPEQRQRGLSLFEPLASQEELDRQARQDARQSLAEAILNGIALFCGGVVVTGIVAMLAVWLFA
jgi:hypothetical protein